MKRENLYNIHGNRHPDKSVRRTPVSKKNQVWIKVTGLFIDRMHYYSYNIYLLS